MRLFAVPWVIRATCWDSTSGWKKRVALRIQKAQTCLLFWYGPAETFTQKNASARQAQHNQIELIIM